MAIIKKEAIATIKKAS